MMNLYIGIEIERVSTQIRYYIRLSIKLLPRIIIHGRISIKLGLQMLLNCASGLSYTVVLYESMATKVYIGQITVRNNLELSYFY